MAQNQLYPYIIVLRNQNAGYINIMGFILTVGSALLFLQQMLLRGAIIIPYIAGVIFIAGLLIWNAFRYFKMNKQIYYSKALMIAGLVWTRMPYFEWLVIIFALLAVLEYQAKLAPEIGFAEEYIVFNGLVKRKYDWALIDNVILKDELLTIDFKNNKLFQREIDSGENEASEQEFTQWCRMHLSK